MSGPTSRALVVSLASVVFATAAAAEPVSLFYLDKTAGGCTARVRVLPAGNERPLFSGKDCPTHVLFDGPRVVTIEGGRLRAHALADGGMTELGELPFAEVVDLWLEESGSVRATCLSSDVTLANGKMKFEGKEYAVPTDDAFPSWGLPAMAILVEPRDGKWTRVELKPTKTAAGDTPGTRVLVAPRNPKKGVVALGELAAQMTCVGGRELDCDATSAVVKKLVGDSDNAGVLKIDERSSLAFAVMWGDTAQAFTPLYLCLDGCKTSTLIEKRPGGMNGQRQIGLAVKDGFVLFVDDYSGENGRVIDTSGRTVFALPKTSSAAVLLPASVAR